MGVIMGKWKDSSNHKGFKGFHHSIESRKKMSEKRKGENNPMYGIHLISNRRGTNISEEQKIKISKTLKGKMVGEKNPNWRGGRSKRSHIIRTSEEYRQWRMSVFKRDSFTCLSCGKVGGEINAHHIKSFKDFPELIYKISNGITLCRNCHYLEHGEKNAT
jgi:hypothetical protein